MWVCSSTRRPLASRRTLDRSSDLYRKRKFPLFDWEPFRNAFQHAFGVTVGLANYLGSLVTFEGIRGRGEGQFAPI
jgi:hypothetical protein